MRAGQQGHSHPGLLLSFGFSIQPLFSKLSSSIPRTLKRLLFFHNHSFPAPGIPTCLQANRHSGTFGVGCKLSVSPYKLSVTQRSDSKRCIADLHALFTTSEHHPLKPAPYQRLPTHAIETAQMGSIQPNTFGKLPDGHAYPVKSEFNNYDDQQQLQSSEDEFAGTPDQLSLSRSGQQLPEAAGGVGGSSFATLSTNHAVSSSSVSAASSPCSVMHLTAFCVYANALHRLRRRTQLRSA